MDRKEYNQWYRDFSVRLPSVHAWVQGLAETKRTMDTWFDVAFSGFSLDEALEATEQLQAGDVELKSWQDLPATYRKIVCDNRLARLECDRREPTPSDFGQYRYRCLICRDTGLVTCWSLDAMSRARRRLRDQSVKQAWTECAVPCSCQRGDVHATSRGQRRKPSEERELPRYNDHDWIRCLKGAEDDDRQALLEWAAAYEARPGYDFAEYG